MAYKPTYKTETCKVFFTKNNKIIIDFKGYGITLEGTTDKNTLKVQYKSDIGDPDFKIIKFY